MENLVVNHINLTLGIAGLVSMILTGCAIQLGDMLYRRFARAQLKHQLGKLKWTPLIAVCLSVSLLTSQMAFGQTAPATKLTPQEIRAAQYQKLFAVTNGLLTQIKKNCKTEACTQAAEDGLALITDAQEKQKNGQLSEVESNRKEFHQKLDAILTKAHSALMEDAAAKRAARKGSAKLNLPELPSCPVPSTTAAKKTDGKVVGVGLRGGDPEMCQACQDTFETLAEICALYAFVNPDAALICLAAATLGFARCVSDWCGTAYQNGYSDSD
jgi:hypothetical protein